MAAIDRRGFVCTAGGVWVLASTGALFADCSLTPPNVAGPYWREGAPFRTRLWIDEPGDIITIAGRVTDAQCNPVRNAVLDLWQADGTGHYDSDLPNFDPREFRLRGRVRTDQRGEYYFQTVRPAPYGTATSMRPAHIHAMVTAAGHRQLITQIYFEGDPHLRTDPLRQVRDSLVVKLMAASPTATMPANRKHFRGNFNVALT